MYPLTLAGAEEILPAGPQQAGESRHAGRDLPLQQWTNSGADLQQVVWTYVPVELHLNTKTYTLDFYSGWIMNTKHQPREVKVVAKGETKRNIL